MFAQLFLVLVFASSPLDGGTEPLDAGVARPSLKAADGTVFFLPDGSRNPAFFEPGPKYRSPEGFQTAKWGISRAEVKKLFKGVETVDASTLGIKTTIAGADAAVFFLFTKTRLAAVLVHFARSHMTPVAYIEDFERMKSVLRKKYGVPSKEGTTWKDKSLFTEDPDHLATAIMMGHAELGAEWSTGETSIQLACEAGENAPRVQILYTSLRLAEELVNAREEAQAEDL